MNHRERVYTALDFRAPDVPALEYAYLPAGHYEHGERLNALWRAYPGDFGDLSGQTPPQPDAACIDADGRYHRIWTDGWGVQWEERVYGIMGHPLVRPLDDWANLPSFKAPPAPAAEGPDFEADRARCAQHMERWFLKSGWGNLFEVMIAVRRFEDVLMDLATDDPRLNELADRIVEYQLAGINYVLACGADAVQLGDDFGTQQELMMSLRTWRRFFKPRLERIIAPIKAAGKTVFFHSCGMVMDLLEDFAEIGVNAIWPQIALYPTREIARRCRDLRIAIAIHPDRSHLMGSGSPRLIRDKLHRLADQLDVAHGGSWWYVELDNGWPYENLEALVTTIGEWRPGATDPTGAPTNQPA